MDNIQEILNSIETKSKPKATSSKKRKWREIEQIKDKFQLEKELRVFDDSLEYMLDEF